jgi:uncharacterized membrane protein
MQQMFLLQILLFAQHVSDTIMPIIRSSRVLYSWLLPVVFGALVSGCRYGVELKVVYGLRAENQSTKYHKQQPTVYYYRAPDDEHNDAWNMLSKQ